MCYQKGTIQKYNLVEKTLGPNALRWFDPGTDFALKHHDQDLYNSFGTKPAPRNYVEVGSAPLQDVPEPQRRTRSTENTLLTGSSLSSSSTSANAGVSLMGG